MKKIFAREEYCLGCKLCQVYCITAHSESNDIIKAHKKEKITAGIIVESAENTSFALQCRHCEEPDCIKACISGALQKNPATGVVEYNEDKCVGCWTCVMSCPYGAIKRDKFGQKLISKCDLCTETVEPACSSNCPNGALIYRETAQGKKGDK